MVHIQLLGTFRLKFSNDSSDDGALVTLTAPHVQALVAYLVLHRHTPFTRHHLAFLFWPESTEAHALTSLRGQLLKMRRLWPQVEEYIQIKRESIQWSSKGLLALDVEEFEQRITQADQAIQSQQIASALRSLERVAALYQGPFLPDCYDDWALSKRDTLAQRFAQAQSSLIGLLTANGDYPQAIEAARRLLLHDPLHEMAYQQLIRLYLLQGDRSSALRIYYDCVALLQRELNVEPSAELQTLHEQLLRDTAPQIDGLTQPQLPRSGEPPILVGRQSEWQQLLLAWQRTSQGHALVVSLVGEAGIGKTRLAESLIAWLRRQGISTAAARCYAAEAQLAFGPLIELLRTEPLAGKVPRLGELWLAYVARLLPELSERYPHLKTPDGVSEALQRSHFYEALARAVVGDGRPLLLVIEDLHQADREMLEWLRYFVHFAQQKQLMLVVTIRQEELAANPSLQPLLLEWRSQQRMVEIQLGRLNQAETAAVATQMIEHELSVEEAANLYHHTDGNPLFIVEMARSQLGWQAAADSSTLKIEAGAAEAASHRAASLPERMKALLQARLNQLSAGARETAEVAAVVGRSFAVALLAQDDAYSEEELWHRVDELWQCHILVERGAELYDFSHPKLREVAYAGISPMRRRLLHRRMAQALEALYAHQADSLNDQISSQIAAHYELGNEIELAIRYYLRAGSFTKQTFAFKETVVTLHKALSLLAKLPDSDERRRQELDIQLELGPALMQRGASRQETQDLYNRALELAEDADSDSHRFDALWGLHVNYLLRANYAKTLEIGHLCLELAQRSQNPEQLVQAYHALAPAHFFLAGAENLELVTEFGRRLIGLYQPEWHLRHVLRYGGHDPCTCTSNLLARAQWLLGYPEQAINTAKQVVALALQLGHPFSAIMALSDAAKIYCYLREPLEVLNLIDQLRQLFVEGQAFTDELVLRGWVIGQLDPGPEAIASIQKAFAAWNDKGLKMEQPASFAMLAETYERLGDLDSANQAIGDALAMANETGEGYYVSELHRLRGTFLLAFGDKLAAQASFEEALMIARRQGAKSLELRAAIDLSQFWARQGRRSEGHDLLARVYSWFSEGFDTADLRQAQTVLSALSA